MRRLIFVALLSFAGCDDDDGPTKSLDQGVSTDAATDGAACTGNNCNPCIPDAGDDGGC
jgi:hypothetical protein